MKKILTFIVLLILACILAIWFFKAPIASKYLSMKLKVPSSIESLDVSKSQIEIKDFKMKDVDLKQDAFTSKKINIFYDWKELRKDPIKIKQIDLENNKLFINCKDSLCKKNNWTKIVDKISEKEERKGYEKEVIIEKLTLKNLHVDIEGLNPLLGIKKNIDIPYLEFTNISSKEGFPTSQLIAIIFKEAGLVDFIIDFLKKEKIIEKYFHIPNLFGENEASQN